MPQHNAPGRNRRRRAGRKDIADPLCAALEAVNRRLALYTQNTPLAIIEWDRDFRVVAWSARAEAMFGWTEAEACAMRRGDWRLTHEADIATVRRSLRSLYNEGKSISRNRNRTKDGRVIHCEWYNSAIRDEGTGAFVSVLSLVQDVSAQDQADRERERLLTQQRIADTLQRSLLLLPSDQTLPGLELAPFYESASDETSVGGDFYDAFALDARRTALVVGDVAGKGLDAAARTAEAKFALRAYLREHRHPGRALAHLNRFLFDSSRFGDMGADASLLCLSVALFDASAGDVEIATAGAEPPVLLRACEGTAYATESGGPLLGAEDDSEFEERAYRMDCGDILCFATDGILEARRPRQGTKLDFEFFGVDGWIRAAEASLRAGRSLDDIGPEIASAAREFAGGRLMDDACLLLARRLA